VAASTVTIPDTVEVSIPMLDFGGEEEPQEQGSVDRLAELQQGMEPLPATRSLEPAEKLPNRVIRNQFATEEPGLASQEPVADKRSAVPDTPLPGPPVQLADFILPQAVQINVEEHLEYGKSLARRGAVYGARQEFLAALRLVAQSIDNQFQTRDYSTRLYSAMTAFNEADDFYFAQAEDNGRVDVATLISRHQSRILNADQSADMTPMAAMQSYYQFVQQQLVACGGQTVEAGEALYCLGKLFSLKAGNDQEGGGRLDNAKALVFYDAAIACDPGHYRSANELGVLMAKSGRLDQAKQLFQASLKTRQLARVWSNLAQVHRQLGENQLAQLAETEYQRMLAAPPQEEDARITWLTPERFASDSQEPVELRTASRPASASAESDTKKDEPSYKKFLKRLF
jgi:tetratricopeptide (TPR) repeat protein